jgi:hypothetical protein
MGRSVIHAKVEPLVLLWEHDLDGPNFSLRLYGVEDERLIVGLRLCRWLGYARSSADVTWGDAAEGVHLWQ